jgi:hypothetical protein
VNVVSFKEFTPTPRYDSVPWHHVKIEESASKDGPWTLIDTINLVPLDADPENPAARDFTTHNATLETGWYRVTFQDVSNNQSLPVQPVHHTTDEADPFLPSVEDVGDLLRARTKDTVGNELGTFSNTTRPTFQDVRGLIDQAADDVVTETDTDIPEKAWGLASSVIALGAAMRIELSYFPEQVGTSNSPYDRYKDLYDSQLSRLVLAVEREAIDEDEGESDESPIAFEFPPMQTNWDTVKW